MKYVNMTLLVGGAESCGDGTPKNSGRLVSLLNAGWRIVSATPYCPGRILYVLAIDDIEFDSIDPALRFPLPEGWEGMAADDRQKWLDMKEKEYRGAANS
jgi:hypothetical protein